MGLLGSLAMLLTFLWILWSPGLRAQLSGASSDRARSLDALLQDYAYKAFVRPRTGIPYEGRPPSNLTGITITVMRLRSGSLRKRGVANYKEFVIPTGVVVRPYVERLALVYQNMGNWSTVYYPLPGYNYLAPVVGLLGYNASNLSATNLPDLDVRASEQPISIRFSEVKLVGGSSTARCVTFDLQGMTKFSNVSSGNVCSTVEQGHFAIVIESPAPSPAPVLPPTPTAPSKKGGKNEKKVLIIAGSVIGGLVVLILLALLILWIRRFKHRKKMRRMERAAEVGESLQLASVGNIRAPVAMGTRTQPMLETEYVP
ncbi:uncharacterized protein LOC122649639 [Telopea speciosissima]|uniref:uncharacterized protein LOC122649639 n=1 Tax=Telopea speciosissima TaxID=54955 RepID=UPI001CC3E9EB|nr:uncharacterized protein LOC122649639 [Telopea speciosissima]